MIDDNDLKAELLDFVDWWQPVIADGSAVVSDERAREDVDTYLLRRKVMNARESVIVQAPKPKIHIKRNHGFIIERVLLPWLVTCDCCGERFRRPMSRYKFACNAAATHIKWHREQDPARYSLAR